MNKEYTEFIILDNIHDILLIRKAWKNQRPDHYTCQVSVYLPSISILIIILGILIFKYWYFLFQKRTEILILQYYFYRQYRYFSIFFNHLVTMFEATKIVLMHVYWSCVVKCANIGYIWALDCVFHNKTHQTTYILMLMSIQLKLMFISIFQNCLVCLFWHNFFQKGYWYWILILQFFRHTDTDT